MLLSSKTISFTLETFPLPSKYKIGKLTRGCSILVFYTQINPNPQGYQNWIIYVVLIICMFIALQFDIWLSSNE